jgi:hypothetical protein
MGPAGTHGELGATFARTGGIKRGATQADAKNERVNNITSMICPCFEKRISFQKVNLSLKN